MIITQLVSATLISSLFISCAFFKEQIKNTCTYDGAYSVGVNDAQAGREMNAAAAAYWCEDNKEAAMKGYREGYMFVVKRKKQKHIIHENR